MRGRTGPISSSKFELKTLKVSPATINEIHAPKPWNKPCPALFDYHYDVAGLYYQPMINYCIGRENGEKRQMVDMPDRMEANLDKVAYSRHPEDGTDYEDFLTKIYQRRAKDKHSKYIRCANKLWGRSKESTDLGMVRGSGNTRDKYLCQIQLYHTGRVAEDKVLLKDLAYEERKGGEEVTVTRRSRRSMSGGSDEEVWEEEKSSHYGDEGSHVIMDKHETRQSRRARSAEPVIDVYAEDERERDSRRYGPTFVRRGRVDMRKLNLGRISGLDVVGVEEPRIEAIRDKTWDREKEAARDQYDRFQEQNKRAKKFMETQTQEEFLKLNKELMLERAEKPRVYKPLYIDTSYAKAIKDVNTRVIAAGKVDNPVLSRDDINMFYRRRRPEDIGKYERAAIMKGIYKGCRIPDFDLGYDTVERSMVCSKM